MTLIRALENRRRMEEREKKRLEARAEKIASKEKRAEQRRIEMELIEQIRKPVEDMELTGKSKFAFNIREILFTVFNIYFHISRFRPQTTA